MTPLIFLTVRPRQTKFDKGVVLVMALLLLLLLLLDAAVLVGSYRLHAPTGSNSSRSSNKLAN
jgi:hypothetical protein